MEERITFGEYVRRLRRRKGWNLHKLAEQTEFAYTHLSRIENDSTIPKAETVTRLAEILDGDLKTMLSLADCLPRAIIDRMISSKDLGSGPLSRVAGPVGGEENGTVGENPLVPSLWEGLSSEESQLMRSALEELVQLHPQVREAVMNLIHNLATDDADQ